MSVILGILYLIMPWIHLRIDNYTDPIRLPKSAFFDFICITMIASSFYYGFKFVYRNKYFMWLFIWVSITILFNWYWPFIQTPDGMRAFNISGIEENFHFFLGTFLIYIIVCSFKNVDYEVLAKFICLSSVLVSLFAMLQISGLDPLGKIGVYKANEPNHFSAFIDHPNTLGNYLALSFPFFLFFKEKKYILGGLICAIGIILSKSSLSITAFMITMIIYIFLKYRNIKILILTIILMASLSFSILSNNKFNKIDNGFTGRMETWQKLKPFFKENPLFGQGLGVVKTFDIKKCAANNPNNCMNWTNAHSDWYERAIEIGILGVFFMILVLLNTFRNFNYKKENLLGFSYLCSLITFMLLMTASFPMGIAPNALLGLIAFCGSEKIS